MSSGVVRSFPPNVGRGACPRYYYDARRQTCRKLNYGCCGGNANFKYKALRLCVGYQSMSASNFVCAILDETDEEVFSKECLLTVAIKFSNY